MPRRMEIGSPDFFERLLMNGIVFLAHAAPFLNKWTECSEYVLSIFGIRQPFGSSRSILQGMFPCLYFLAAILAEERGQVGG